MVTTKEIRSTLSKKLKRNLWFTDGKYKEISSDYLKRFIKSIDLSESPYIRDIHECEEFSLSFLSKFRERELENFLILKGERYNAPVGICAGTKFEGILKNHTMNIAFCSDGIFLIEPQSNFVRKYDEKLDDIFFIFM